MSKITKLFGISAVALALSACNSSSSDPQMPEPNPPTADPEPEMTELRVHHGAADAPAVNITVDGDNFLEAVDYQVSSAVASVEAGEYAIGVDGILPNDDTVTVLGPLDLELEANMRYEIFALGSVADETLEPFFFANEISAVASGDARVQVLHGVPVDLMVDVYVTAPGAELADEQPIDSLNYQDYTPQLDVPAGDYQVRLTVAGDPEALLFDSGELPLADGSDLVISAVPNVSANYEERPIALLVADGEGTTVLHSADTGADLRVVHAIADAPAVDILVNEEVAVPALEFPEFTGYLNLPAAEYSIAVNPADTDDSVIEADLELANATRSTVLAVGSLSGDFGPAVLDTTDRRVATEARVRIVHAAPSAGEVDIYVTPTDDISEADPAFAGVDFDAAELQTTGLVSLAPGEYWVTVTLAGTQDAAIGPIMLELDGSGLYTAIAVDDTEGGLPPQLILMDDLEQ